VDLREDIPKRRVATPEDSNYYMLSAEIEQMDKRGKLRYRMAAARVLHYPDNSARMHDIDVRYLGDGSNPWTMEATAGHKPAGSNDIHLTEGVVIHHDFAGVGPARLETSSVWLRHEQGLAETQADVHATAPGRIANASGMTVRLNSDHIILHKDVKVTYAP